MSNNKKDRWVSLSVTTGTDIGGAVAHVTYWCRDAKGVGRIEQARCSEHATAAAAWDAIAAWQAGPDGHLF
jgi:hypothetical protein